MLIIKICLEQAWDLYYHVFRRIDKQLQSLTTLDLEVRRSFASFMFYFLHCHYMCADIFLYIWSLVCLTRVVGMS